MGYFTKWNSLWSRCKLAIGKLIFRSYVGTKLDYKNIQKYNEFAFSTLLALTLTRKVLLDSAWLSVYEVKFLKWTCHHELKDKAQDFSNPTSLTLKNSINMFDHRTLSSSTSNSILKVIPSYCANWRPSTNL